MDRLGGGSCTGRTNDGNRRLYPLKCQCEVVISGTYFEFGDSIHAVLVVLWSQVSMRRQFLRVRPCALADNGYNIPRSYAPWLYRIITSECMFECLLFCRRVPLIETSTLYPIRVKIGRFLLYLLARHQELCPGRYRLSSRQRRP